MLVMETLYIEYILNLTSTLIENAPIFCHKFLNKTSKTAFE